MNEIKVDITNVSEYIDELIYNHETKTEGIKFEDISTMYPYQLIPFERGQIYSKLINGKKPYKNSFIDNFTFRENEESENKTYVAIHNVWFYEREKPFGSMLMSYEIDKNGNIIKSRLNLVLPTNKDGSAETNDVERIRASQLSFSPIARSIFLAVSLMNCKNVEYADEPNKELKEKHNQKKHKKNPRTIYKVLVIDPMKKILHREGDVNNNGIKKALHICRGHFRDYSEGKPLFGKVSGRFWIGQHTRGDSKYGTIEKDYRISI